MSMRVAVVGSGPAGVAAARGLLDGGHHVDLLDFGNDIEPAAKQLADKLRKSPHDRIYLDQLKPRASRNGFFSTAGHYLRVLLGRESVLQLVDKPRLGSSYTFADVDWGIPLQGPDVARSLAKAGLSNIWGASCYPLTEEDYQRWPIPESEMKPHYEAASAMLNLIQIEDALAGDYPIYGASSEGLPLNSPAQRVLNRWQQSGEELQGSGIAFGRARLAVREQDSSNDSGCKLCGLCLSGCPYDAIYRSEWDLEKLLTNHRFNYRHSLLVHQFRESANEVDVISRRKDTLESQTDSYDAIFLAAGTSSTIRIVLESMPIEDQSLRLLDNDLYLAPFIRIGGGRSAEQLRFSLNELVLRMRVQGYPIHVQFYCLNDQVLDRVRGLLKVLPFSEERLRRLFSRCMLGFIYLPDRPSAKIAARLLPGQPLAKLDITQRRRRQSRRIVRQTLRHLRKNMRSLGLFPVGFAVPAAPQGGGGGHLSGGLPMSAAPGSGQTDLTGKLNGTDRVYIVDSACLPALPAQNSTYTIMANAHRIAHGFNAFTKSESLALNSQSKNSLDARYGYAGIDPRVTELDHHDVQYGESFLTARYHYHVLRTAVRMAELKPGMHILDYGCSSQQLRTVLPPGIRYTGYDVMPESSDIEDPRESNYDRVFALQVLLYFDDQGLADWVETFSKLTHDVIVMLPARNFVKDEIADRIFGLKKNRDDLVRTQPFEIYEQLERKFTLEKKRNVFWMGEVTRWKLK